MGKNNIKKTKEIFVEELKRIQPNLTVIGEYINNRTPIRIISIFGECMVTPYSLLQGNKPTIQTAIKQTEYFDAMFKDKHPNNYNKIKILGKYIKSDVNIIVRDMYGFCKIRPSELLRGKLPTIRTAVNMNEYFINESIERNQRGGVAIYGYTKTRYVNDKTLVIVTCPIHGDFMTMPSNHLQGCGCPICAKENKGWSRSKYIKMAKGRDVKLYKIRCFNENEDFYKIGITVNELNKRFSGCLMSYEYEVVSIVKGEARFIWDLEKEEHRRHIEYKYNPLISFKGDGECFSKLLK